MDNLSNNNHLNNTPPPPVDDLDKPIPLGDAPSGDSPGVSRAPLNLGGGSQPSAPPKPAPKVAAPKPAPRIASPAPVARKPAPPVATATAAAGARGRITGMKTFFTKLHPGALEFLDEQISKWLEQNPQVDIKHTNITTGEVQAKKTEPNIIITVWY